MSEALTTIPMVQPFIALVRLVRVIGIPALLAFLPQISQAQNSHVPQRILVKFRDGVTHGRAQALLASVDGSAAGELANIGVTVVTLPAGASEEARAARLRRFTDVEFAEVDAVMTPQMVPNDPNYFRQWHLPLVSMPMAWDITHGSASVTIAFLDTGLDPTIQELAPLVVPGWNMFNNNSDTSDVVNHGTGVVTVAACVSNEGFGAAAGAWNCRIMPVRVSDSNGYATVSTIASGLTWAADHGARVANVSYAFAGGTGNAAARYFMQHGGVVTAPSGNDGSFSGTSDDPTVLTVSATNSDDTFATFSNYGSLIDLSAPGNGVVSAGSLPGYYRVNVGTCASAAIVASVAALVISANPSLTGDQAAQIIRSSTDDLGPSGWDNKFGTGRVNAGMAVQMAMSGTTVDTAAPTVSFAAPSAGSTVSGTVAVNISASDNVAVTSVAVYVDGNPLGSANMAPYSFTWNTAGVLNGSHTLSTVATDAAGNSSNATVTVQVSNASTGDTTPPSVTITSPTNGASAGRSLTVYANVSDNVGVQKAELFVDGALVNSTTRAPFTTKWSCRNAAAGAHLVQVKATDRSGNTSWSQTVTVYK